MEPKPFVSVIIVTYNCPQHLERNIHSLLTQSRKPDQIVIVDNNSTDSTYLDPYKLHADVIQNSVNTGFCYANNQGMQKLNSKTNYVLFLNPDAFLSSEFIERAVSFIQKPENNSCGALSGILFGYDAAKDKPTGLYDSTGIFSTPYGRWFDRDQGQPINQRLYKKTEEVQALCGALMFCRLEALKAALLKDKTVWDNKFFMYKDDIDLSLRLRRKGWRLLLVPELIAFHCRGWSNDRQAMSKDARLISAKNEIRMHIRAKAYRFLPYSVLKYAAVKILNI